MKPTRRLAGLSVAVATAAAALVAPLSATAAVQLGGTAYDVSFPQCGRSLPAVASLTVLGVNGGAPFRSNSCLGTQYRWAKRLGATVAFYVNSSNPGPGGAHWPADGGAYQFGYDAARDAFRYAAKESGSAVGRRWWIDVETTNKWTGDPATNVAVIQAMHDYLTTASGVVAGVYSTPRQWTRITGGAQAPGVPNWLAGPRTRADAAALCTSGPSLTGGPLRLVQYPNGRFDGDYIC